MRHRSQVPEDGGLVSRCRQAIKAVVPDASVILYGSRARGDHGPDSDYDLLVLVDGPVDWRLEDAIRASLYPLELETGKVITLVCYGRDEWNSRIYQAMPFVRNVERDGIVL